MTAPVQREQACCCAVKPLKDGRSTVVQHVCLHQACGEFVEPSTSTTRLISATHPGWSRAVSAVITSVILILLTNIASPCLATALSVRTLPHYARAITTPLLEVFQVYPPVLTVTPDGELELTDGSSNATIAIIDSDSATCQRVLVQHSFAYSYGEPFVGNYTPPPCAFNRVTWNLTVTSAGRQFDRLGVVYLGDIEVFRTSTAEPTANGIEWTYLKAWHHKNQIETVTER